ncbi:hypothetical protein NLJ89_g3245 [Agrocybe chaxingu]|uniref:Uncharacterized protein n=1 Tax=Agrocybe chaxingu TaxID=84603 RepID=A0A9W8K595_9AGAR|nr:hypothetical protein NLJ89_g3245 [Agrocybe chaxingu]
MDITIKKHKGSKLENCLQTVPQEIVDLIIDIGVDETKYISELNSFLLTCSLISRSFHVRARVHLFRDVEITFDSRVQKRAKKALNILRRNNNLVLSHVRRFFLIIDFAELRRRRAKTPLWRRRVAGCVNHLRRDNFADLLRLLTQAQLEDVVVKTKDPQRFGYWNDAMTQNVVPLVSALCSQQTVRFVCFRTIRNIPYPLILAGASSRNADELMMRNVSVVSVDDAATDGNSSPTLKTLELTHSRFPSSLFSAFSTCPILSCFARVTSLTISSPNSVDQVAPFWKIVRSLQLLESVSLNVSTGSLPRIELANTVRLDQLPHLRSLKFTVTSKAFPGCFNDGLGEVLVFLQPPASSSPIPQLRSFELCVHSKIPDDEGLILAFLLGDFLPNQWRALDATLMGVGRYPGLQQVKINLHFSMMRIMAMLGDDEQREMVERKAMVMRDMHLLAAARRAGSIEFDVETPWTYQFRDPFV